MKINDAFIIANVTKQTNIEIPFLTNVLIFSIYLRNFHVVATFQLWLDITTTYNWPTELSADVGADSTHSYDSRPEADLHLDEAFGTIYDYRKSDKTKTFPNCPKDHNTGKSEKCPFSQTLVLRNGDASAGSEEDFNEGPFLRMIFKLLSSMPDQPYQVNLHLTSIISKLALLPHPYLHEYLLNPDLPTSRNTPTLFKTLQELARRLTMEVPRIKNYKKVIETTRQQLMSEDPSYDEM